MLQSLHISFCSAFRNPSKLELITMNHLISSIHPSDTIYVNYTILEGHETIQSHRIHGRVPNMKLLNHFSLIDYKDSQINIQELMKELK